MSSVIAGVAVALLPAAVVLVFLVWLQLYLRARYMDNLLRIFEEKPLFVIPRGLPDSTAEDLTLVTPDGFALRACYLKTKAPRRGVVWFGLEFGSNRWSCRPYCEALLAAGYDVFACESRNQGDSQSQPSYRTLQWATDIDLVDARVALEYLKSRPDADPKGVGLFGISKGGTLGLIAAAGDPFVRCVVTDGAFATYSTVVPYMRKWVSLYNTRYRLQGLFPSSFYGLVALAGMRKMGRAKLLRYLHLEDYTARYRRPLFMIHGECDSYIKVPMAQAVFDAARSRVKEFWAVPKAKHNQALHVAGDEYRTRVTAFFDAHLASAGPLPGRASGRKPDESSTAQSFRQTV